MDRIFPEIEILQGTGLGEESQGEAGKVGPQHEIEGVEAQGASGGVLQVVMATVEALSCQLHPTVVEHGTGAHQGVVLEGEGISR